MPARTAAGMPACRQAGVQADRRTGTGACLPVSMPAKEYTNPPVCIVSPLRGSIWLRSGSLWRFSAPSRCVFTPYLCPQAAGQRSRCAHRTPAPSFFWAAEGYRATDTFMGCYNRSIPNPSCTDSCVLKDTARCPLSNSKGFRLLPETHLAPCGGGLPLRSREACFLPAVCVPEAAPVP